MSDSIAALFQCLTKVFTRWAWPNPYADDLATLVLDVMVADVGWARHAPNPLLLVG